MPVIINNTISKYNIMETQLDSSESIDDQNQAQYYAHIGNSGLDTLPLVNFEPPVGLSKRGNLSQSFIHGVADNYVSVDGEEHALFTNNQTLNKETLYYASEPLYTPELKRDSLHSQFGEAINSEMNSHYSDPIKVHDGFNQPIDYDTSIFPFSLEADNPRAGGLSRTASSGGSSFYRILVVMTTVGLGAVFAITFAFAITINIFLNFELNNNKNNGDLYEKDRVCISLDCSSNTNLIKIDNSQIENSNLEQFNFK